MQMQQSKKMKNFEFFPPTKEMPGGLKESLFFFLSTFGVIFNELQEKKESSRNFLSTFTPQ